MDVAGSIGAQGLDPDKGQSHRDGFATVAKEFQNSFCLTDDEQTALHGVHHLRNRPAHSAVSVHFLSQEGAGGIPGLAHRPRKSGNNPCRKCPGYPEVNDSKGVIVDFGDEQTQLHFDGLRTVGTALDRIADSMGLRHRDLL